MGNDKVYDAHDDRHGLLRSDTACLPGITVSVTYGSAAFADPNAGTNKAVTVNGLSLGWNGGRQLHAAKHHCPDDGRYHAPAFEHHRLQDGGRRHQRPREQPDPAERGGERLSHLKRHGHPGFRRKRGPADHQPGLAYGEQPQLHRGRRRRLGGGGDE